jgi:hypothetical protein
MKISTEEFKEWHDTAWPEGFIWCDESTLPDGRDIYVAENTFIFEPGEVFVIPDYWTIQKEGEALPEGVTIRSLIRAWRKKRDTVTVVVQVPKAEEAVLRSFVDSFKRWKVTS